MRKIIASAIMIVAVAAVVTGATVAYFRSSKTSTGNVLGATTFNVRLAGETASGSRYSDMNEKKFFNVSGMVPGGDPAVAYVEVKNESNTDMLFRFYAKNVSETESGFRNYLNVKVTLNPSVYTPVLSGTLYGATDNVLESEIPLSSIIGAANALDNVDAACKYLEENRWPIPPGYVAVYKVEVGLDWDTPDIYQGASLTADLQLDAVQFNYDEQCPDSVVW